MLPWQGSQSWRAPEKQATKHCSSFSGSNHWESRKKMYLWICESICLVSHQVKMHCWVPGRLFYSAIAVQSIVQSLRHLDGGFGDSFRYLQRELQSIRWFHNSTRGDLHVTVHIHFSDPSYRFILELSISSSHSFQRRDHCSNACYRWFPERLSNVDAIIQPSSYL